LAEAKGKKTKTAPAESAPAESAPGEGEGAPAGDTSGPQTVPPAPSDDK
jgi:hypothetical protein